MNAYQEHELRLLIQEIKVTQEHNENRSHRELNPVDGSKPNALLSSLYKGIAMGYENAAHSLELRLKRITESASPATIEAPPATILTLYPAAPPLSESPFDVDAAAKERVREDVIESLGGRQEGAL